MSSHMSDVSRLWQVTEAAYAAEQAKMTRLNLRETQLRQQLSDLAAARKSTNTPMEEDAAARAGADFLWQKWVDSRVTDLNSELARVLVEKSRVHASLTRAFGKFQVTGHLFEQARRAQIRDADRRDERRF